MIWQTIRQLVKNPYFIIAVFSTIIIAIWFHQRTLIGAAESALPFYNLQSYANQTNWAWSYPALGNVTGLSTASGPTYVVLAFLASLGISSVLLEAVVFWLFFVIAGTGMYLLVKELLPTLKPPFLMLAVLYYWFNPFVLVNVWVRFLYNYMVFWAMLPTVLFLYWRGLKRRSYAYALYAALLTVVFSYAMTSIVFTMILFMLHLYFSLYYWFFTSKRRIFYLVYFAVWAIVFFFSNMWWVSQLFSFVSSKTYSTVVAEFFTTSGNLANLTSVSERLGRFTDILRMLHNTYFHASPSQWPAIYISLPVVLLEYLIVGGIFWVIIRRREQSNVLILAALYIIALFLMKGNQPPFGEVFQNIFVSMTIFQIFRHPFEKFGFLLPLTASPLFALAIYELSLLIKKIHYARLFYWLSFSCIVVVFGFPFWTGLALSSFDGEGSLRKYNVEVPSYYADVNAWLLAHDRMARFLSLPLSGEGITYTWPKPYAGVELSSTIFNIASVSFDTIIPFYHDIMLELTNYQLDQRLFNFLPFLHVKYIVWRGDIDYKERKIANPQTMLLRLEGWVQKGLITQVYQSGQLIIYKLADKYTWPKIYTTNEIIETNNRDVTNAVASESAFPSKKVATIPTEDGLSRTLSTAVYLKPDRIFSPQYLSVGSQLSDQEILSRLFYVHYLPTSPLYPLIRIKETLETPPRTDYSGWLLYKVGILGKRAVETYQLTMKHARRNTIKLAEQEYRKEFVQQAEILNSINRSDDIISVVAKQSLIYQLELFYRAKSGAAEFLLQELKKVSLVPQFSLPSMTDDKIYLLYQFQIQNERAYQIQSDQSLTDYVMFFDGKIIDQKPTESQSNGAVIHPSLGYHELAIQMPKTRSDHVVLFEPSLHLTDEEQAKWRMDFSGLVRSYDVTFDYRFTKGSEFAMRLDQDIDVASQPVYQVKVVKDPSYHDYSRWQSQFVASVGAAEGIFSIKPNTYLQCSKKRLFTTNCQPKQVKYEVDIKNLRITQASYPQITLFWQKANTEDSTTTVSAQQSNPALYQGHIIKQTSVPELLVFSELYNPGWQLTLAGQQPLDDAKHILVNGFGNGWLINNPVDADLTISFLPQRKLSTGRRISAAVFFGVVALLIFNFIRKRK